MENLYIVTVERHTFKDGEIVDSFKFDSYFSDYELAKKHAKKMHADGMRMHRETNDQPEKIVTDVWLTLHENCGGYFLYRCHKGHFTSHDYDGRLILSHCDD